MPRHCAGNGEPSGSSACSSSSTPLGCACSSLRPTLGTPAKPFHALRLRFSCKCVGWQPLMHRAAASETRGGSLWCTLWYVGVLPLSTRQGWGSHARARRNAEAVHCIAAFHSCVALCTLHGAWHGMPARHSWQCTRRAADGR